MKFKFLVASLLAAVSFSALAADQNVVLSLDPDVSNSFTGRAVTGDGILSGGKDVISFTGLASGFYDITVTLTGQNLTFNDTLSTLNGSHGVFTQQGKFKFFGVDHSGHSPFTLNLFGTALTGAKYSGVVSVSAVVPEPETYGMLLGGLGLIGFAARRKAAKKA